MNKKFDLLKETLTDFQPEAYQQAAQQAGASPAAVSQPTTALSSGIVTKGRTTLTLSKIGGTIQPSIPRMTSRGPAVYEIPMPPIAKPKAPPPPVEQEPPPTVKTPPTDPEPVTDPATAVEDAARFGAPMFDPDPVAGNAPDAPEVRAVPAAAWPEALADDRPELDPRDETAAVMRVKATTHRRPKKTPEPEDNIMMSFRLTKYLHSAFLKSCADRGTIPSVILRNMIKQYAGLCLFLAVIATLLSPAPAFGQNKETPDRQYTSDEIMKYLKDKAFGGIVKNVPGARGSIGARHSLWQTGATEQNVEDFVYTDNSQTRLEAKIEIPIFDLSYLRNKDKEKLEFRSFVMKSLSRILAAQKAVNVIEVRIATLRERRNYVNNQITLKLANRSDLFVIEDNLSAQQAALFEAQSTLEQRAIDLAMLAEEDWLVAYNMILKWDGVLIPSTTAAKGKK